MSANSVCVILSGLLFVFVAPKPSNYPDGDFSCTLPPHPEHGHWTLVEGEGKPGDKVPLSSVITFECASGYRLSKDMPLACLGNWSSPVPECEELCPSLYPSDTYSLKCIDKIGDEVDCSQATHGTNLEFTCKTFYETPSGSRKSLLCEDGKWDNPKPVCEPVCGKKIVDDTNELIFGSKPSEKIEYPWVAAVYQKTEEDSYENICGGSILSQTVALTAAHCVTNSDGKLLPKEDYMVGVGKLYREYLAPQDKRAQYSELLKIIIPKDYKADNRKFAADIAVLVVKKQFILSEVVQPVCFTKLKDIHLHAGNKGEVSGWGYAEGNQVSEVLRSLVIPYKYETVCAQELPPGWSDRYNLGDKICAGFVNKSTSVCKGDSGGGLVFKFRDDKRYYIHGIVSVAHKMKGMCNIQQNAIYTKVAKYYDFVNRSLTKYAPKVKDCVLPNYPQNGKWTTDAADLKPGDAAPSTEILKIECDKGYTLSSARSVECNTAHNMPTCDKLCSGLKFPKGTEYKCIDRKGSTTNCSDAVDGTLLSFSCPNKYKTLNGVDHDKRICVTGSWGSPEPDCILISKNCGKKVEGSAMEYPWNVGVYKMSNDTKEKYRYLCGGSLVSEYVAITDVKCVTDIQGNVPRKEDYLIASGKFYGKYEDSRDKSAQILNLSYIIVHPEYKKTGKALYNVAFLVASSPFKFNDFVQPICLADEASWSPTKGLVIGWRFKEAVSSEKVEALEVEYLKEDSCKIPSPLDASSNLHKVCASFNNKSTCLLPEDFGKGLIVKHPEDGRYYLHGVVAYYDNAECQNNFWSTDLFHYRTFADRAGHIFSS